MLRLHTFQCKTEENMLVMSLKYTPVTQCTLSFIFFNIYSNYAPFMLQWTRIFRKTNPKKTIIAVYDSDILVTLK